MKSRILFIAMFLLVTCSIFGCSHQHEWESASCFSPKTCIKCGETEGTVAKHVWTPATCQSPSRCKKCGKTEGVEAEHTWSPATCFVPKTCTKCKKTEGVALGHSWSKGSSTTPRICYRCNEMEPLSLPNSGQVFIGKDLYRGSELSIKSKTTESCYIKLKGSTGIDVFSFFVKAGTSVTVSVPNGYYYVYFAYGDEWYGTEYLFGSDTTYTKDDELLDFKNYTWEYTLEPVINGNFSETPIDEDEFK